MHISDVGLKRSDLLEMGMKHPARVVHKICGGTVMWYDGVPKKINGKWPSLNPAKAVLPNGARPAIGDEIKCTECTYEVLPNGMDWIVYD